MIFNIIFACYAAVNGFKVLNLFVDAIFVTCNKGDAKRAKIVQYQGATVWYLIKLPLSLFLSSQSLSLSLLFVGSKGS